MWIHTIDSTITDSWYFIPSASPFIHPATFRQAAVIYRMWIELYAWFFFFSDRLCIQTMLLYFLHPNPPEESWSSLMGFWLFAETMCCCAEGCKVNLGVFEVGVVPHWLSLSSLIAFFISSRSRSFTPRISCTLAHISALWTVTKAFWGLPLYFFFALPLFDLC